MALHTPHKNSSVLLDTHGTMLITLLISEPLAQMTGTLFQTSLVLYDYIGSNPAKGGLFRSGPMLKADGLVQNWLGHALLHGYIILKHQKDAYIAFRRSTSTYSMEESKYKYTSLVVV